MTAPIAALSVAAWLRHPFADGREMEVARLSRRNALFMWVSGALVTWSGYFVLRAFGAANLLWSTASILTSYLASYLMLFRSPAYTLAYAANDAVLIALWGLAALERRQAAAA